MNILLIDKRVQDYETIVAAIDPALAVGIIFDYYEDTFDTVKAQMRELGIASPSVGLIQHNYKAPMFTMLASADVSPVAQVATQDPDLAAWTQFRDFISWCKTDHGAAHFDMMACALYSDPDWKYVIDTLTTQTGVTVRASTDNTGAASLGGDWFLESHTGINLKTVYFTEAIDEYRGVLYLEAFRRDNQKSFTKGLATGSIVAWGSSSNGGTTPGNATSGVVGLYSTGYALALLKTNGTVIAWGDAGYAGIAPSSVTDDNSGVVAVYSTRAAFAALKNNGSIVSWGDYASGGWGNVVAANSGVIEVYSTNNAFAALKTDGSVFAWGNWTLGSGTAPRSVTDANSGVIAVYSHSTAFAALKSNGSVIAWGGGGAAPSGADSGVIAVYNTNTAFAALKNNGSVIAWGGWGGTAPTSVTDPNSGVVAVYSNNYAFAALKTDGSVVAWGHSTLGGTAPSVTAANSRVIAIYSTEGAFAALKNDGSIVAWGDTTMGGADPGITGGIVAVYSNLRAFAALKTDGSIIAWGDSAQGGTAPSSVADANSGVVAVYSVNYAFAALKSDGSVITWGNSTQGGTAPSSVTDANSGVVAMYSSYTAFSAIKTTATTFDLSFSYYSVMDRYDILRKKENRRRVNLTTLNNNVFTLSTARDIQIFNPNIPSGKTLRIIIPNYVSSSYSITSTATIPSGSSNVIIACDQGEPVTISGTTYVNYGTFVYTINASGSYVKTTSTTIDQVPYSVYGGDGIMSSGIGLLDGRTVPTLSSFSVAGSKTFGAVPFRIDNVPTSDSSGAITYSSNATGVATIDPSSGIITLVAAGTATFTASQAASSQYNAPTPVTSNTLTVLKGTTSLSSFSVAESKKLGEVPFSITAPTSDSSGAITYSSNATNVATINASSGIITLVAAGTATFTASQAESAQYNAPTPITSNTLTVSKVTTSLTSFSVAESKMFGAVPFSITAPTSDSSGAITYSSNATNVATIDPSSGIITLVAAGTVTFTASQAESAQYDAPTPVTSNTLTVARGTTSLTSLSVAESKTFGSVPFSIDTAPMSDSSGAITYSSNATGVATIDPSSGIITLVAAGTATFTASQAESPQYNAPTPVTSNTLTVSKGTTTLAFVSPPTTKSLTDPAFTVVASSASSGAVTYTSSNTAFATVGATSGLVTLKGVGTVTITAAQAESAQYNAPANTMCSIVISSVGSTLAGQTVPWGTSFAGLNLSGASLVGTTLSGVSFSGATLTNANFSGTTITGTDFTNANISGATNLPAFSPVQKLQLLKNINNVAIEAVQITTVNGSVVEQLLSTPIAGIDTSTFLVVTPTTVDASSNKTVTITSAMIGSSNVYVPVNTEETIVINGTLYRSNGTNIVDANDAIVNFVTIDGVPFRVYAGSFIGINRSNSPITVIRGMKYILSVNASGHPFWIQTVSGAYSSDNIYSNSSIVNNGSSIGNIIWDVPFDSPNTLYYACQHHSSMQGIINIVDGPSGATSGAVTYTSSNTARATVGLTTGLVTPFDTGPVTITAAQAASSQYNAPTNTTCTITIGAAENLAGTVVTTSLASKNLTGASLVGTNLTNISLANTNLRNADLSGAIITGASFINTDISGATNLPVFSTTQKLQLMRNANNAGISAVQISTTLSGAEINAAITTPIPDISDATFVVKAPSFNASNERVVTVTAQDVSNNASLYIPMNSNETVKVNGVAYTFDGTNILDSNGSVVRFINILGKPFRLYAGSIVGLNVVDQLNNIKISGDGLYDILTGLFAAKT